MAERPICTAGEPKKEMRLNARHPETRILNNPSDDDHGDEHHECVHCGFRWWKEGPDY